MKNIMIFGDSNAYGVNPDTGARYDDNTRWPMLLARNLKDSCHVITEGLRGRCTIFADPFCPYRTGSAALPMLLATHAPLDLVILALGTNDTKNIFNASPDVIASAHGELINMIRDVSNARILLLSPVLITDAVLKTSHITFDKESIRKSHELKKVLSELASRTSSDFLDLAAVAKAGSDGLHMDMESHFNAGKAVTEKTREILSIG